MYRRSKHRQKTEWLIALCGVALLALGNGVAVAQERGDVKAAIVYNILRFVSFPGSKPTLTVCARRQDNLTEGLKGLQGRAVATRKIDVVVYDRLDQASADCDVIYVGSASARSVQAPTRGQILIGEHPAFIEQGGTVGLVNFGSQVRFTINARAARNAEVRFSSQLMQLAARVIS